MIDAYYFSSEVGNVATYWTLQTLFYLSMIICGRGITFKTRRVSDIYCIATIVIFSVYESLRWLRGADYSHYYVDLTQGIIAPNPEPLYKIIVSIFGNFPFYYAFMFYGFLLICPVVLLLRKHKKEAYWILPLFIIIVSGSFESLIRQYIAVGFFLFGFYFWQNEKKELSALFFIATMMSHLAVLFPIFVFLLCVFMKKIQYEIKSVWIPLAIFFCFYWFWDVSYLENFANYLHFIELSHDNAFYGYIEDSERWFTDEGSIGQRRGISTEAAFVTRLVFFLLNTMTIYWGYKYRKKSLTLNVFFWFTYWSLIIRSIAGDIEIILRFSHMLIYMTPFMMGIIVCNIDNKKMQSIYKSFILLYYFVYIFLLHLGTRPYSGCGYIWDR